MFHYVAIKPPVVRVYVDCKLLGGEDCTDPYLSTPSLAVESFARDDFRLSEIVCR
jgi:hypothetical protein